MDNFIDIQLSAEVLSIDNCYQFVLDDASGGNCLFVGTVRNKNKGESVTHLDFESYEPMAIKQLRIISERAIDQFGISKISIHHRTGYVGIRDIAVIIAVSSLHRDAAFQACRFAIDELKKDVPIWKKEHLEDGSYWVNARP